MKKKYVISPNSMYLDVETAASLLGVSKATIYKLCRADKIPNTRVAENIRIYRDKFLEQYGLTLDEYCEFLAHNN